MKISQVLEARGDLYSSSYGESLIRAVIKTKSNNPPSLIAIALDKKPLDESSEIMLIKGLPNKWKKFNDRVLRSKYGYSGGLEVNDIELLEVTEALMRPRYLSPEKYPEFLSNLQSYISEIEEYGIMKHFMFDSPQKAAVFLATALKESPFIVKHLLMIELEDAVTHGDTENIGDSRVLFPDNMRPSRKQNISKLISATNKVLENSGFGYLTATDILIAPIPKSSTIGLYYPDTKQIRIDPATRALKSSLHTMVHEYGHKYWYEFMDEKAKQLVIEKFKEISANDSEKMRASLRRQSMSYDIQTANLEKLNDYITTIGNSIAVGDTLEYKGRKHNLKKYSPYTVINIGDHASGQKHIQVKSTNGYSIFSGTIGGFVNNKFFLNGKELKVELEDTNKNLYTDDGKMVALDSWFPSVYSKKDHEEWFAEVFAFYLLGQLNHTELNAFAKSIIG